MYAFSVLSSCDTQLISVIHEWAKVLDISGQVDVIFLDFAKAFDSVPHARLLLKARHYGIRGKLNEWLRDFLSDRWQRVAVNECASIGQMCHQVSHRVPFLGQSSSSCI